MLAETLRAYLDAFGDIAAAAHVITGASQHGSLPGSPNRKAVVDLAVRSRVRLFFSLGLRATEGG